MRSRHSPFDAPVSFGAAVETLELVQHRVLAADGLFGVLHVAGIPRTTVVVERTMIHAVGRIGAADGAQSYH